MRIRIKFAACSIIWQGLFSDVFWPVQPWFGSISTWMRKKDRSTLSWAPLIWLVLAWPISCESSLTSESSKEYRRRRNQRKSRMVEMANKSWRRFKRCSRRKICHLRKPKSGSMDSARIKSKKCKKSTLKTSLSEIKLLLFYNFIKTRRKQNLKLIPTYI